MAKRCQDSLGRIILDEVALEGLEGTTLRSLWVYVAERLQFPLPLTSRVLEEIWLFLLRCGDNVKFYELPVERPTVKLFKRFEHLDDELGVPIAPLDCPIIAYKYKPIKDGKILGSCECYEERKEIPFDVIRHITFSEVLTKYGNKLVIVGSQELRYRVLLALNNNLPELLTPMQYCVWEAIGRSRYNGETTAGGAWSLLRICGDSSIMFYIKNKLLNYNLITQQPLNEKRNGRLMSSSLLTLPQFHSLHKTTLTIVIEKIYFRLKEQPNNRMNLMDARNMFPKLDKIFKAITATHFFRRVFNIYSVPYSETTEKSPKKRNHSGKERMVLTISLRNPNLAVRELFTDNNNKDEGDEKDDEKIAKNDIIKHDTDACVDMPMKDEFYHAILRHGERGLSQSELCTFLGQHHLTVRSMIKNFQQLNLIKSYQVDVGRQRINMYVAHENSSNINKKTNEYTSTLQNLKCNDEPNIPECEEATLTDIQNMSATIKPFQFNYNTLSSREGFTQRQAARKAFIIQWINDKCLVAFHELRTSLQNFEKSQGLKDEVCQKSIKRLVYGLSVNNVVCAYDVILQFEEHIRLFRYVTHPKISPEHPALQREVLKLKNQYFLNIEERRLRQEVQLKEQFKKNTKADKKLSATKRNEMLIMNTHKPPKFIISRFLHEFLFYIIVELNESQKAFEIDEQILMHWKLTEPEIQIKDFLTQYNAEHNKDVLAYTKDINWRTFISPLPTYGDKPASWVYFIDAIDRMPLSLFNKIFRIEKIANKKLYEYLNHPIRQHYLMRQLPLDLQHQISRIQLQRIYLTVLKLLNNMGLIQVHELENTKDPLALWVFLNRRAKILDTTSSEPSYFKIDSNREYTELEYEFNCFDDIYQYWTNLQRICIYTQLGLHKRNSEKLGRIKEIQFVSSVGFDEALMHDVGQIPGDHLGAAGLNTSLFAHACRNWSWAVQTSVKLTKGRERAKTLKHSINSRKTRLQFPSIKRLQHGVKSAVAKKTGTVKKSGPRDAIDRDAMKNMRTLRVQWTKAEDEILLISRAVYLFLAAPISALGLLTTGKICRDIMRRTLGVNNKTSQSCSRRIQFLIRMRRHIPQVPSWLHTLQTNATITQKYGDDFLEKLKECYPNRVEYCNALAVHFMRIMRFLYALIYNTDSNMPPASTFSIPDTITEYNKKYTERDTTIDQIGILYENPETEFQLQTTIVIAVLHSSLSSARDKTLYNLQAFEIYKTFSEEVLRTAFAKARTNTLVVALKRKNFQLLPNQIAGPAYLLSARYRMRLLFLKIPYSIYDSYYAFFKNALNVFFATKQNETENDDNSCVELKSPHSGQLMFIAEGLMKNFINMKVKFPVNILTVDAEQKDTVSSMDRILDHYSSIFDHAPQTEYLKQFETESNEKQVRVKFHPANLSYKIHYTPFDLISKLPTRYLHFFCALDHLQQEVDINFSKLYQKDEQSSMCIECPFSCVMKNANYINAIERIVHEKKSILNSLTEMPAQKLLNMTANGSTITVQTNNLLTLFKMLESFCYEREKAHNRKDLGKISTSMKIAKPVDWQEICKEINEFNMKESEKDKTEGYEPTLNKEERIVRAQDVFVINLPTLQISANPKLHKSKEKTQFNGIEVPKSIVETQFLRDIIFKKLISESHWKYTENTIETLKPKLQVLKFSAAEQKLLKEVHDYIESEKFGVTVNDLLSKFPNRQLLLRILHALCEYNLIKRVGVATFVYVHKTHIRQWVVHTFHIKRLENEKLGSQKRTYQSVETIETPTNEDKQTATTTKKFKTTDDNNSSADEKTQKLGKRIPKPIKKFDEVSEKQQQQQVPIIRKDIIAMRPQPWIRLNGSLNRRVLDRWLGTILNECIARAGCYIQTICEEFLYLHPADIMFLLEVLNDLKSVSFIEIQEPEVDLFTKNQETTEVEIKELYDPKTTYIKVHEDAIMRLTIFIGDKKYTSEFIQ